jgi:hypothetical protein
VCAKRSKRRTELIMNAADLIRNDHEMVMWVVMSTVERVQMCVDNHGGHFGNARRM